MNKKYIFFSLLFLMMTMVFIGPLFNGANGLFGLIFGGLYLFCLATLTFITYFLIPNKE